MKILESQHIEDIVNYLRSKTSITSLTSKIVNGQVKHEDQTGNYITLRFYDTPDPVKTTVRMEVRIHGKDEKTTYGELTAIDKAVFTELTSALPLELDNFIINNIVPRSSLPDLGTKDRKETLRDYVFYF